MDGRKPDEPGRNPAISSEIRTGGARERGVAAGARLAFRVYHDRSPSFKDYFAGFFRRKIPSYSEYEAVNDVSFRINSGDRVGIIGGNGAGKSTLLKAVCRVYESSDGTVFVDGRIAPLLEIGAGFHPEFTGRENIYLNGSILGYSDELLANIESEVISFAGIEEFIDTPVKYYSTGMYMRLAFSLATAIHPDILVLDEIFAGGDAAFLEKAKSRMHEMINKSNIMIMVSHDHNLVQSVQAGELAPQYPDTRYPGQAYIATTQ